MAKQPAVKPHHIALICILAVAAMFIGSIVISVAVVQAERAQPASSTDSDSQ
jgi:hypothetical protein